MYHKFTQIVLLMDEMSFKFRRAYAATENNGVPDMYDFKAAIPLYDEVIAEEPNNFAAWNNRGYCKVMYGHDQRDKEMVKDGTKDFETAVDLANESGIKGYSIAESGVKLGYELLRMMEEEEREKKENEQSGH